MDITSLEFEIDSKCRPKVSVWAKCHTVEDVDDIIAWLHLAKDMMRKWEKIRSKHAPASQSPKAAASENEDSKPGQVQGGPRLAVGSNG
jgi:hypothetical protein